jgi:hypothetical protein
LVSQIESRLKRAGDLDLQQVTVTATVPVGGGSVPVNAAFSQFSAIDAVVSITVTKSSPFTAGVDAPQQAGSPTGNQVGFTLSASAGTTLTAVVTALGH